MVVVRKGDKQSLYRNVKRPNLGGAYSVKTEISPTFRVKEGIRKEQIKYWVHLGDVYFPASFKGKLVQFIVEVVDKEKYEEDKEPPQRRRWKN